MGWFYPGRAVAIIRHNLWPDMLCHIIPDGKAGSVPYLHGECSQQLAACRQRAKGRGDQAVTNLDREMTKIGTFLQKRGQRAGASKLRTALDSRRGPGPAPSIHRFDGNILVRPGSPVGFASQYRFNVSARRPIAFSSREKGGA